MTPRVPTRLRRVLVGGTLTAWMVLGLVGSSTLMASHTYTLPRPDTDDPAFLGRLRSVAALADEGEWSALHVLYAECRCSQRIFDHLFTSVRPGSYQETIVVVGADEALHQRAVAAGFEVLTPTAEELASEFRIESAPLLLVLDPDGRLVYAGGYTERKQGYEAHDLEILTGLKMGKLPAELPLYGCGVSRELQAALDPLGLKYR